MYLVVASQSLKREDVGSTTIRQQFATKLLLRTGEAAQGRALGLEANWCKAATAFQEPGLAVYAPSDGQPEVIRVPYVGKADAAHILRGATLTSPAGRPQEGICATHVLESTASPYKAVASKERLSATPDYGPIVQRLKAQGMGKGAIIETVWGYKPGSSPGYKAAHDQYRAIVDGAQ